MLVQPEERRPLADLLRFLEQAERLAHNCAAAQTALAPEPRMSRFLRRQAHQEAFHATVFQAAAMWLAPHSWNLTEPFAPLIQYGTLIDRALNRKDFLETVLAEQVILESLGEAILNKLEAGLTKRNAPFRRLRHLLLHQEEAHHGFGERILEQAIADGMTSHDVLRKKAIPYLDLSESLIMTLQTRLEEIDEDPCTYVQAHRRLLPAWLINGTKDSSQVNNANRRYLVLVDRDSTGEWLHV